MSTYSRVTVLVVIILGESLRVEWEQKKFQEIETH